MSIQIADIILYGPSDEPRVLSLRQGQVNIITGSSKTGKSSLISIVDYCLGASECGVAYGAIRSTVEWYALRLVSSAKQILVARRAPDRGKQSSGAVYYEVGSEVDIPPKAVLQPTTNIDAAIQLLSRECGIGDNLHEVPPGQTRSPLAATIKHALYFCFQPQDEIISRKTLFFQQSEPFIPQAIKDALPYFLGAVDSDHLIKAGHLRSLRQELKRVQRDLAETEALRGDGSGRATALLHEASAIGMLHLLNEERSFGDSIALLQELLEKPMPSVPDPDLEEIAGAYELVLEEREELIRRLRRVEADLRTTRSLADERRGYADESAVQAGRLRSIDLLTDTGEVDCVCPLCLAKVPSLPDDNSLRQALRTLDMRLKHLAQDNPHLEGLTAQLEGEAASLREQLAQNRVSMEALQRSEQVVANYRDLVARVGHVKGRISLYLETVPETATGVDRLSDRGQRLRDEITELEAELSDDMMRERVESILSVISHKITAIGTRLELEHSSNPLRFDIRRLTVVADTPDGPGAMDKMGSGANWVGYHIAVHLALHQTFVAGARPVPRFLFVDQPSQVYFPADRDREGRLEVGRDGADVDEDRAAVLRTFELVRDTVASLDGRFQVIITEHADPDEKWYQEAVVERWRHGNALIPQAWIDAVSK